jgi:hypothetical protein
MTASKVIIAVVIHLLVPLVGLAMFVWLCFRMRTIGIPAPPFVSYFILFVTCGGWLLVALTALFWEWSGMASVGVFFLTLVAPWITAAAAWRLGSKRTLTAFHRRAFFGNLIYSGLMFISALAWLSIFLTRPHS